MEIKIIGKEIPEYISKHQLQKKWDKTLALFSTHPTHRSLNIELLEPKHRGIYSFRVDRKFRALFTVRGGDCYVFKVTNHYKK